MLNTLLPCLGRGSVCALASLYASSSIEKNHVHPTQSLSSRTRSAFPYFLYGFITYPIILYNFRFVKNTFIPYIQQTTLNKFPYFQGACINELILWPLNTYPILCLLTPAKYNDILPVTAYSSMFWIPFSCLQAKYTSITFFAPIRLCGNFIYYVFLFKFCNGQNDQIK